MSDTPVVPPVAPAATPTPAQVDVHASVPAFTADYNPSSAPSGWSQGQWDRVTKSAHGKHAAIAELAAYKEAHSKGPNVAELQAENARLKANGAKDVAFAKASVTNTRLDHPDVQDMFANSYTKHKERHTGEEAFPAFGEWLGSDAVKQSPVLGVYFTAQDATPAPTPAPGEVRRPAGNPNGGAKNSGANANGWASTAAGVRARAGANGLLSKADSAIVEAQARLDGLIA